MLLSEPMVLFAALCFIGVAIGGLTAFVIFWPLSLVHLRDRHPEVHAGLGPASFLGAASLCWLLRGQYRQVRDAQFTGLATPARVAAFVILAALAASAVLWLWALLLS
jgi:hypothetical protein